MAAPRSKKSKAPAKKRRRSATKVAPSAREKAPSIPDDELDEFLAGMRKDTGAVMMKADDDGLDLKIRGVISTRCPTLDAAIGRGGVPLGRLTILHGAEGSGKTTVALQLAAETIAQGGLVMYMDKEYKLDMDYAQALGVRRDRFIIVQPPYLEMAFETMYKGIEHAAKLRKRLGRRVPILVVLDSMNAAITKAQFEGDWDQAHMAPQARCYSSNLPKLIPKVSAEDVALVWVSQVRTKMNVTFGSDEDIAGGKAPRFYASLIIHIKRIGSTKDKDGGKTGNKIVAECRKNQIAPPFRKAEFMIRFGKGIDAERSVLELALERDVIEKAGAWYSFEGERLAQGLDNSAEVLRRDPDLMERIWVATAEAEDDGD